MKHQLEGNAQSRQVWLDGELLDPRPSQRVNNHSPDGFNWGYGGSGPAQLALAIMLKLTGKEEGYQHFKWIDLVIDDGGLASVVGEVSRRAVVVDDCRRCFVGEDLRQHLEQLLLLQFLQAVIAGLPQAQDFKIEFEL